MNYRVSGKQAAYVYAMAEKRGKDRVILKLIELHGLVYSEEEADEFRNGEPGKVVPAEQDEPEQIDDDLRVLLGDLKQAVDSSKTINAVTDLMLAGETQQLLANLPPAMRDDARDYAKARLVALGWSGKRRAS